MEILIKAYADENHKEHVIALWVETFLPVTGCRDANQSIDKRIGSKDGLFFVALDSELVVGTVLCDYDGYGGWLYSIAVKSSHRRLGIGTALVQRGERELANRGCVNVSLQVVAGDVGAVAFYTSLGYTMELHVTLGKKIPWSLS